MQSTAPEVEGQPDAPENRIDIAGFSATLDPRKWANASYEITAEESDRASLAKLHYCGLNVASLDEAHTRFKLSPLRTVGDVYKILGYPDNPIAGTPRTGRPAKDNDDRPRIFTEKCLTSLAIQFPDPQKRGEVYPHTRIVRVRYPSPVTFHNHNRKTNTWDVDHRKYSQPAKKPDDKRSTGEPYFLFKPDMWDKIHDVNRPLYITESELKAVSLGLAGQAAIGFCGVNMWGSPKGKKHQLHASIDPNGPLGKSGVIPVKSRQVVVMFDTESTPNANVITSAKNLAKALLVAGASSVKIAHLPAVNRTGATGVDDFLHHHLGDRWSGDVEKLERARELIEEVAKNGETFHSIQRYKAYSATRCAQRIVEKLSTPQNFAFYEINSLGKEVQMLMYNGFEYAEREILPSVGSTSGKVIVNDTEMQKMAKEAYEEGVNLEVIENGDDPDIPEMPTDFPQRVFAEVRRELPKHQINTVIGEVPGAAVTDQLIRVKNGLINLSQCLADNAAWETREKWLLAPSHHFLSSGAVNIQIPNQIEPPECPEFLKMLNHGFDGDQERITCLQRYFGKVVCNPVFHGIQRMMCFYGTAGGGKSTVVDLLTALLGPGSTQSMTYHRLGQYDTGYLPGKKLIVFPETGGDGADQQRPDKFSPQVASIVKSISSGEMIPCERKMGAVFSACIRAEIILVSNPPPIVPMDRGAFMRRAVFLRWSRRIIDESYAIVEHMHKKELPGIFLWALRGAADLQRLGGAALTTPEYCKDDMEEVTESVDPVATFVREQLRLLEVPAAKPLPVAAIREHFQKWLIVAKIKPRDASVNRIGHQITQIYGQHATNSNNVRQHLYLELSDPQLRKAKDRYGSDSY